MSMKTHSFERDITHNLDAIKKNEINLYLYDY